MYLLWMEKELAPNVWLHISVGQALHQYRGGHRLELCWSPDFFSTKVNHHGNVWLYKTSLSGQQPAWPLLVVYSSSGWEVVVGSCCWLDGWSQTLTGSEEDRTLSRWSVLSSAVRSKQCAVVLEVSVDQRKSLCVWWYLCPPDSTCHDIWRWWQGSTFWILDRVLFSLDHLGSRVENPLQISCHGRSFDWLSAGLNITWHLGGCMLWVLVHEGHEERGVCSLGIYPSGAMLVRGWFLHAGLSCNAGDQVGYQWLSCSDAFQSLKLQPLGSQRQSDFFSDD